MVGSPRTSSLQWPNLGLGLGLRATHYPFILEHFPTLDWFEAISENFMGIDFSLGGKPMQNLLAIRERYPIVLHGVSLSIGSVDPLNQSYLKCLKELVRRVSPAMVSDHLCWTGVDGENLHDLLPLPYTEEALAHVVRRIVEVQEMLGQRILIENVSSYLSFSHSEMTEWEFLSEVCQRADCGLLLDVNNIFVSSVNHNFDPELFLQGIPVDRVGQFHLAGYSDNGDHLIDTHDHPVSDGVWNLYESALRRFGRVNVLLERDDQIPEFPELFAELQHAGRIRDRVLAIPTSEDVNGNTHKSQTHPQFKTGPTLDALDPV